MLPQAPSPEALALVRGRQEAVAAKGSRDTVVVVGRVAFLHTPDGFGTSELARMLTSGRSKPLADGTARTRATIAALLALCDSDVTGP